MKHTLTEFRLLSSLAARCFRVRDREIDCDPQHQAIAQLRAEMW